MTAHEVRDQYAGEIERALAARGMPRDTPGPFTEALIWRALEDGATWNDFQARYVAWRDALPPLYTHGKDL